MPVRSPHGRAAAYRTLWQWPLRSPARLAGTVVAVLALAVGVSLAVTAVGGGAGPGSAPGPAAAGSRSDPGGQASPTATVLPPVPDLKPTALPLSKAPAAALDVARRWTKAWVRPVAGVTAQQWLDGLRPLTTDEYLGVLGAVDPANIPATRVTGNLRPVQVAARSVQVQVPTDGPTLLVLVVSTESGWRVAGYERV
jgi:hypothetical protein